MGILMDVTSREEAFSEPESPKSQLFTFERTLFNKKCMSLKDLLRFFQKEGFISMIDVMEGLKPHVQSSKTLSDLVVKLFADYTSYTWGEPLECDFQVMKTTRRTKKTSPYPQRYHCRVYISEEDFVIISERETNPQNVATKIVHVAEGKGFFYSKPEHRKIRVKRCESLFQKLKCYFFQ